MSETDVCPVCGTKCQVECDSEGRRGNVHAVCSTCGTKWRRRESHGKLIYEKWAHRIPELNIAIPFVGGGAKLGPRWFRWVKIRKKWLSPNVLPKIIKDEQLTSKIGKTYYEKASIKAHDYAFYPFELLRGDIVKGEIASDVPINVWFLDEENFDRLERRKSFEETDGTEAVYETKPVFKAPRKGTWLIVIENKNKFRTKVSVHLYSER